MLHNPFTDYRVSAVWGPGHEAVDYATPIGFTFGSPGPGTYRHVGRELTWSPGMAGIYGDLHLDDGRRIRFCHLDRHIARDGERVAMFTPLAATGNTGYVLPRPSKAAPHAGAHMHTTGFDARGRRWNWTLEAGEEEEDMGKLDDTEENYQIMAKWLQRALQYDVRVNGYGTDQRHGNTIWEWIESRVDNLFTRRVKREGGRTGETSLRGMVAWADTNLDGLHRAITQVNNAEVDAEKIAAILRESLPADVLNELARRVTE